MATLSSPINTQNIVDRFADYAVATANAGITWGTNALPFTECDFTNIFGGATSGKTINVSGTDIDNLGTDNIIEAQNIYDILIAESLRYTSIRKITAQLFVTGAGGNNGTRTTEGTIFNQTRVAHLSNSYLSASLTAARDDVVAGNYATSGGLEVMFSNMQAAYTIARESNAGTWVTSVCHASCHTSCHNSRGRR